jgi:hypothetical protein
MPRGLRRRVTVRAERGEAPSRPVCRQTDRRRDGVTSALAAPAVRKEADRATRPIRLPQPSTSPPSLRNSPSKLTSPIGRDGPKTDNQLIMTAEQGSQTEREPRVAGKQWPTGVHRGIRRSSDRLLAPFPCRWALSCRMVQRDAKFSTNIAASCIKRSIATTRL